MKGWLCRGPVTPDSEAIFCRRVMAAAIVRAIEDAQRGDAGAAQWLESVGRAWCELLRIPVVDDWQAAGSRLTAARRELLPAHETAEYWRQYRAARRDDSAFQERERAHWARTNAQRRTQRVQKRV